MDLLLSSRSANIDPVVKMYISCFMSSILALIAVKEPKAPAQEEHIIWSRPCDVPISLGNTT
jgi:hypothetical protein